MSKSPNILPQVDSLILTIRNQRVILDTDLAALYGVPTKRLNEQIKRNASRFPDDFAFRLTTKEKEEVVANCGHLARLKFSKTPPTAFTEHGAIMSATVLNSPQAVTMSIYVIRAFVRLREELSNNATLEKRLLSIEKTLLSHDSALRDIIQKIRPLLLPPPETPRKKIGFITDRD
jgi:hypothetical protein